MKKLALILLVSWPLDVWSQCQEPILRSPDTGTSQATDFPDHLFELVFDAGGKLCAKIVSQRLQDSPNRVVVVTFLDDDGREILKEHYAYRRYDCTEIISFIREDLDDGSLWKVTLSTDPEREEERSRPEANLRAWFIDTFVSNIPLEDDTLRERALQLGR